MINDCEPHSPVKSTARTSGSADDSDARKRHRSRSEGDGEVPGPRGIVARRMPAKSHGGSSTLTDAIRASARIAAVSGGQPPIDAPTRVHAVEPQRVEGLAP